MSFLSLPQRIGVTRSRYRLLYGRPPRSNTTCLVPARYALLAEFLSRLAEKPLRSVRVKKAASVLLKVINGYAIVSQQLGVNTKVMADELSAMIWSRLTAVD